MADKTLGGPAKGMTASGDQTALPGQAAGKLAFGIQNPLATGAPGTPGVGEHSTGTPTLVAPVPDSVFGAATKLGGTGAPGTSGAAAGSATGATYTLDSYGASPRQDMTGGSVDTEAQANKYGTDTGIPGLHTPGTTGAPGSVTNGSQRIH